MNAKSALCSEMNTLIRLVSTHRKMDFLGEISELRLKWIMSGADFLLIGVVKLILDWEFMFLKECYKVDLDISSWFVVDLLDPKISKDDVAEMTWNLFIPKILGGLEEVLEATSLGLGIPRPRELELLSILSEVVIFYPFILNIKCVVLSNKGCWTPRILRGGELVFSKTT